MKLKELLLALREANCEASIKDGVIALDCGTPHIDSVKG